MVIYTDIFNPEVMEGNSSMLIQFFACVKVWTLSLIDDGFQNWAELNSVHSSCLPATKSLE